MKKCILFVDDNPAVLDGYRVILHSRRKEWSLLFAQSGEDALKILESNRVDVVVADIRMPGMDGVDLLNRVQMLHPEIGRVILSGYSDFKVTLDAVKPAHQFLAKPCQPEILQAVLERMLSMGEMLATATMRCLLNRVDSLPVLPELYVQVTEELVQPEPSLKRIGAMVERDVGMSAALLKIVNSAFFGLYSRVSSPSQAVMLLGTEILQGLILGIHFLTRLEVEPLHVFSLENLWRHSLQTGYFAKAIAAAESQDEALIDACFLAGLLHDIGKLVLVTEFTGTYEDILKEVQSDERFLYQSEYQRFEVSHAEVGAYLLGIWGIPEAVVSGVFSHHDLQRSQSTGFCPAAAIPRGICPAVIVHAANCLEHELVVRHEGYTFSPLDQTSLEQMGLGHSVESWREICVRLLDKEAGEEA